MTLDQIKAMPVKDLSEENAHLYLWIPNGLLQEGLDVIKAWGFTYRSMLTWTKSRLGLGVYIRSSSETILFATRGHAPVKFHGQGSWLFAPVQEHSHKPEEQFAIIERLSDGISGTLCPTPSARLGRLGQRDRQRPCHPRLSGAALQ